MVVWLRFVFLGFLIDSLISFSCWAYDLCYVGFGFDVCVCWFVGLLVCVCVWLFARVMFLNLFGVCVLFAFVFLRNCVCLFC